MYRIFDGQSAANRFDPSDRPFGYDEEILSILDLDPH